jgi:hypothetical protein
VRERRIPVVGARRATVGLAPLDQAGENDVGIERACRSAASTRWPRQSRESSQVGGSTLPTAPAGLPGTLRLHLQAGYIGAVVACWARDLGGPTEGGSVQEERGTVNLDRCSFSRKGEATIPATAPAYAATRLPGQAPVLTRS